MSSYPKSLITRIKKTYCRIKISKIEGVGIFAIRDIPANTNPFYGIHPQKWYKIPVTQFKKYDPEIYKMIDDFYVIESTGSAWLPENGLNGMDISFFLNQSRYPNIYTTNDGENFLTCRLIKKGEELTIAYATYNGDTKWFLLLEQNPKLLLQYPIIWKMLNDKW